MSFASIAQAAAPIAGGVLGSLSARGAPRGGGTIFDDLRTPGFEIDFPVRGTRDIQLARTPELTDILGNIQTAGEGLATDLTGLLPQVAPGFGRLTEARVRPITEARERRLGNLTSQFSRRRALGSSFAQEEAARQERQFAQDEADVRAASFMEELQLTRDLLTQRAATIQQTFATLLDQANFEAGLGAQIATGISGVTTRNAEALAQLAAQSAAGRGALGVRIGDLVGRAFANSGGDGGDSIPII